MELPPSLRDQALTFFSSLEDTQPAIRKRIMPYSFIKCSFSSSDHLYEFKAPRGDHDYLVCRDCMTPKLVALCNGRVVVSEDETCPSHQETPDADLDTHKYGFIRSIIGLRSIMVRTAKERTTNERGQYDDSAFRKQFCDEDGIMLDEALFEILRCERVHMEGCMHSEWPETIVSGTVYGDVDHGEDGPRPRKGDIASNLYFKHCDGSFQNAKGERLVVGSERNLESALEGLQI